MDKGVADKSARAGHEPSQKAVSAVPVTIANAWKCGHERTDANTKLVRNATGKTCRICFNLHLRDYRREKRAAIPSKGASQ